MNHLNEGALVKALVVYDSAYGNTGKIAEAIAEALGPSLDVRTVPVGEARSGELAFVDLVIIGSPTHGGGPTPLMQKFLNEIPKDALSDVGVAAFDTRFSANDKGIGLRVLMRIVGYAADYVGESLKRKGGYLLAPPEGFFVEDKEGPLKEGELERAGTWAKAILEGNKQLSQSRYIEETFRAAALLEPLLLAGVTERSLRKGRTGRRRAARKATPWSSLGIPSYPNFPTLRHSRYCRPKVLR